MGESAFECWDVIDYKKCKNVYPSSIYLDLSTRIIMEAPLIEDPLKSWVLKIFTKDLLKGNSPE